MPDLVQPLRVEDLDPDPFRQFALWFEKAVQAGIQAPEAAAVASAGTGGEPSVRMVLIKQYDEHGFVFFTHYESRKGRELTANPHAALLFYWEILGRQVRIEGPAERTSAEESSAYARSRPRASQLSALVSPQTRVIDSREELEQQVAALASGYQRAQLPAPESWGGFRVIPHSFEFWQRGPDRLHDRLRYTLRDEGDWQIERLAP